MNRHPAHSASRRLAAAGLALLLASVGAVPAVHADPHQVRADGTRQPARTRFHFDRMPVRSALQLLAEEGGFNLVVSDSVTGTVTLHLDDVTWEQALAIVLRLKGLQQRVLGDTRTVTAAAR